MALHPRLDGQRSVGQAPADSRGRGRVRDARLRRSLLHRDQRVAGVFDALPRCHVLQEGAFAGADL